MEIIATLAVLIGASWCAGINLYATVAVLGLMHRFTGFDLPPGLEVLASAWVVWPAVAMYAVEFVADKVPAVDNAWDAVHSFIRIPAGAALAAGAVGDVPVDIQVLAAMIGGGLALTSHATKATTRLATHASGASAAGPVISLGEDILVIGTMSLIAAHPVLALFIVTVMIIAAYFAIRAAWRIARKAVRFLSGSPADEPTSQPAKA